MIFSNCFQNISKLLDEKKKGVQIRMEQKAIIYLAGGCFWGTEKYFSGIKGVLSTLVGYANGITENPTYEEVCKGNTGFAETVEVVYDPTIAPLSFLLEMYYKSVNPTSINKQGGDTGVQYRTGIYYQNQEDYPIIRESLDKLQQRLDKPVAIELKPLENFFPAEEYHQKYLEKNPNGYCHIPLSLFEEAENSQPN